MFKIYSVNLIKFWKRNFQNQLCLELHAGQEAGYEAAIHAKHRLFESNRTEAIVMVDAENVFNWINRKALLHNIEYLFPVNATLIYNCFAISARLFIIGRKELRLRKGTTQGDPTVMAVYALGWTPSLDHLQSIKRSVKYVAFADDLTRAGKLEEIKIWWNIPNMIATQSHQCHSLL